MDKHPIENIMSATMESIRDMVDVNTVIGDAVTTADGATVIPISRVSFGFASGGGEYGQEKGVEKLPFAGGTGAGVSVSPVGFLVLSDGGVRLLPAEQATPIDRAIELLPQIMNEVKRAVSACANKAEKKKPAPPPAPPAPPAE